MMSLEDTIVSYKSTHQPFAASLGSSSLLVSTGIIILCYFYFALQQQ